MPTGATGQLGLALPVQGELSGTWGDTVNNGITQYVNVAIAGTLSFAGDGAITLANTTGDATASNIGSTTAQYMVIRVTGALTTTKSITAPSYSKIYLVDNAATGGAVSFLRSGQATPVTIAAGESAFVYFNGTDYIKVTSDLILGGYATTVTAAGTTTLTSTSAQNQFFTGSSTQTVVLPVAATLILGVAFSIHNNSAGDLTINSSGGNLIATITPNTTFTFTCILTSGTDAASWDSDVTGFTSLLPIVRGGTGTATPALVAGSGVTISGSWPNQTINATGTGGTVTGVNVSGGTTGLTTSGGPVTTSGTITLAGTLAVASGGTGLTSTPANGQLDIGNGTGFSRATLTAGSGIAITNGAGTISIATSGGGGTVTSVSGTGTVNGLTLSGTVTSSGSLTLGGTLSSIANSALSNSTIIHSAGTGISITNGTTSLGGTVTITNSGVTSVTAGTGISVSASTGGVTITSTASGGTTMLFCAFSSTGGF